VGLSRHTGHEGLKQVHGHRYFVRSSRNALRLLVAVVPTHFLWAHPASPKRSASGSLGVTATIQPSVELTVRTAAGRVLTATGNLEASVILTLGAERQVTTAGRDPIRFTTRLRTANVGPAEGYQLGAILLAKDNQVVEVDGVSLHGGMQANITSGGIAAFNRENPAFGPNCLQFKRRLGGWPALIGPHGARRGPSGQLQSVKASQSQSR